MDTQPRQNTRPAHQQAIAQPRLRVVGQLTLLRDPVDALTLLMSVVTDNTRYLVLDLDRTIHRGWNLGELLGWDVIAWHHFGDALLDMDQPTRAPGRFHLDATKPRQLAQYLAAGVRRWANPGSRYFLGVKAGTKLPWTRRLTHHRYGPDPVAAVQTLPRVVAMHHLSEVPLKTLHALANRIWDRHAADQVFLRSDFDALRRRFPNLKIILSSASPQPMVDVAKARLGVDDALFSSIELHDGYLSAPYRVDLRYGMRGLPRRIAGPARIAHNAGRLKIPRLKARYPDIADGSAECVGITDTGYGEDHDWANHFTRVVDVNSDHPFAPIVPRDSPLRAIWSARLLTAQERGLIAARRSGATGGPATDIVSGAISLDPAMQRSRLQARLAELETLATACIEARDAIAEPSRQLALELAQVRRQCEDAAERFNAATGAEDLRTRQRVYDELMTLSGQEQGLVDQLAVLRRPLSALVCRFNDAKALSRRLLATPWPQEVRRSFALSLPSYGLPGLRAPA